jgi:copper homeostasis protein
VRTKLKLEICAQTVEAAVAAENGGADRIELCEDLAAGGVTPREELMRQTRARVGIPIFAMIRPRAADFIYSGVEFEEMRRSVVAAKDLGMDGVVMGILSARKRVDVARTRELVELAKPLPATFHRAFDETSNLMESLEAVLQTGAERILTSGGATSAPAGAEKLAELVTAAEGRIIVLPGAGLNAENIVRVARITGAGEFHSGLSSALPYTSQDYPKFELEVRKLRGSLTSFL